MTKEKLDKANALYRDIDLASNVLDLIANCTRGRRLALVASDDKTIMNEAVLTEELRSVILKAITEYGDKKYQEFKEFN